MTKVMVFGTFDGLHEGHLNFFKQAKKYGDYLVVVIARDDNVKKLKGKSPQGSEKVRLQGVEKTGIADKVILGHKKNPYKVITEEKPDIVCLGYDQNSYDRYLPEIFPQLKIIRLKAYKPDIYKSSLIKK